MLAMLARAFAGDHLQTAAIFDEQMHVLSTGHRSERLRRARAPATSRPAARRAEIDAIRQAARASPTCGPTRPEHRADGPASYRARRRPRPRAWRPATRPDDAREVASASLPR